jgi:glycerol-3-phosphate dehydrogenase
MRSDIAMLDGERFDVVVVGGGINGASTAQHLAAAGYKTLIIDKGDFGSGSSSRSSRLLHCGLRYLAPGRTVFDFVRHPTRFLTALKMARLAMDARSEFVRTSSARTNVMALHFPIYRDGPYAAWQIDTAFKLLEWLGPSDIPLDYRRMPPSEVRKHPLLGNLRDLDQLVGVAAFREYQFNWPERIALDAILDSERLGATARNYTSARLHGFTQESGWTVELTDVLRQSAPVEVHASAVLMMAGVWMDGLLQDLKPHVTPKVFGTKGCHLVVKLPDGCAGAGIATLNSRNEPLYCIPWKQYHYFGPTETPYEGDLDRVFVTVEEADDLLNEVNKLLPSLGITADDIRLSWAGVRPLTYDADVPFGNRSRMIHDLASEGLPNAWALTAGPVMTHRSAARELTQLLGQHIQPSGPAGSPQYLHTADRSGSEHAATLSDELFRRSGVAWSGSVTDADVTAASLELGAALGWGETQTADGQCRFEAEWNDLYAPPHSRARRFRPEA